MFMELREEQRNLKMHIRQLYLEQASNK